MIQVVGLTKSFAEQVLFEDITFTIGRGEKVGLVGRNGSGKSTLLKILLNQISPDSGELVIPKNYRIGNLEQHLKFTKKTILEEASLGLLQEFQYDIFKAEKILMGLGFKEVDFQKHPSEFSGGQQIRINLAKVLLAEPDLLFLDEPTNYLDILGLRWLKNFLKSFKGELVLITHDRGFMDDVVTHTMGIWRQKLVKVEGNTSKFYEQLSTEEEFYEKARLNQERKRKDLEDFVNKFRAKARQASLAQSRVKMLDKMPKMKELQNIDDLDFHFNFKECPGKVLLKATDLAYGYDGKSILFENLSFEIKRNDKFAIIGKNGKGKSTLLNILGRKISSLSGQVENHPSLLIGHFGQTNIEQLYPENSVEEEIASVNESLSIQRVRSICGTMMFSGDLAKKKVRVLSGGERARVLLGKILAKPTNLLLLDEPSNHLDQESVESLTEELKNYPGAVMVVTHSESFLKEVAQKLIIFRKDAAEFFLGGYQDFLEKVGWEDDLDAPKIRVKKKDLKKERAILIQQRTKELSPFKKKMAKLEQRIETDEKELKKVENKLSLASQNNNAHEIKEFSISMNELKDEIELNFDELTKLSLEHDEIYEDFESKIQQLSDS